jgi:hypothetical protein
LAGRLVCPVNENAHAAAEIPNHKRPITNKPQTTRRQTAELAHVLLFLSFGYFRLLFAVCSEFVAWCLEFDALGPLAE